MPSEVQTPNDTHANAARLCEMAFKAMRLDVERAVDYRNGYDFLVEGKIRVACRYAMPTSDRQQVYTKRNGEVSTYSYKRWTFNFHRHGRIVERYCDFFVCFLVGPEAASGISSEVSVFVIPWDAITGLTFCSSVREGSMRGYRGKYSVYKDAWSLIESAAHGRSALVERKRLLISADSRRHLKLMIASDGKRSSFAAVVPAIETRRESSAKTTPARGGRKAAAKRSSAQVLRLRAE
jgi:hypothetical protein